MGETPSFTAFEWSDQTKKRSTYVPDRRCQHHTRWWANIPHLVCQHHGLHIQYVWKSPRHQHTEPARKDAQVIGRRHRYSASIIKSLVGRRSSVTLKPSPMSTDGARTSRRCNSFQISTKRRWTSHRSFRTGSSTSMMFSSSCWETGLTRRPESLHRGRDFTAGHDANWRTRTPMLTPLQSYAGWGTHRAHRSSARNSSANNSFGVSLIPNWKNICGWWFGLKRIGSSKPSLRCVQISPASTIPRTSTDRRNKCSQ